VEVIATAGAFSEVLAGSLPDERLELLEIAVGALLSGARGGLLGDDGAIRVSPRGGGVKGPRLVVWPHVTSGWETG
jgi:hypothetical protein